MTNTTAPSVLSSFVTSELASSLDVLLLLAELGPLSADRREWAAALAGELFRRAPTFLGDLSRYEAALSL